MVTITCQEQQKARRNYNPGTEDTREMETSPRLMEPQGFLEESDADRQRYRFLYFHSESEKLRESGASFHIGPELSYIKEQGSQGDSERTCPYTTSSCYYVDWITQGQN